MNMPDINDLQFYKSLLGEWLAVEKDTIKPKIYYSTNGVVFNELFRERSVGANKFQVENCFGLAWTGQIIRQSNTVTLYLEDDNDRPVFRLADVGNLEDLRFEKLPMSKVVKGLFVLRDHFVCWVGYKYYYSELTSEIWFGVPSSMKKAKVLVVLNGEILQTEIGDFDPEKEMLGGYALTQLNEELYDIKIADDSLTISDKE